MWKQRFMTWPYVLIKHHAWSTMERQWSANHFISIVQESHHAFCLGAIQISLSELTRLNHDLNLLPLCLLIVKMVTDRVWNFATFYSSCTLHNCTVLPLFAPGSPRGWTAHCLHTLICARTLPSNNLAIDSTTDLNCDHAKLDLTLWPIWATRLIFRYALGEASWSIVVVLM